MLRNSIPRSPSLPTLYLISPDQSVVTAFVPRTYSREEAQSIIDEVLMPKEDYGERIGWGRDAQGLGGENSGPLQPTDPRLSMTYAEFPLTSMDELIDLGLQYLPQRKKDAERISMVDLGSGCGRLVIYSAMTRGSDGGGQSWDIQGIEIADLLHEKALGYMNEGAHARILSTESSSDGPSNTLSVNLGPAEKHLSLLHNADIVFAYSTAFPAKKFSPELGALILDPEWSDLLSKACSRGCVAITTDRALDPFYGWELADRLDVENREVFGTTGYVQVLCG